MILIASDLDNTLIYSYKRDIGKQKVLVECYEGREVSYMTKKSHTLLQELYRFQETTQKLVFIPLTTRSTTQYQRIFFSKEWQPHFALTGNGGTLLVDGKEDVAWTEESKRLIAPCENALQEAEHLLQNDAHRTLDVRRVNGLFTFTKSDQPQQTIDRLKQTLSNRGLSFFQNGVKVYALPTMLNKGTALKRLKQKFQPDQTIAAGDSSFDIEMLQEADIAFAPTELKPFLRTNQHTVWHFTDGTRLLSDTFLSVLSSSQRCREV